jgi:hypothetical protein
VLGGNSNLTASGNITLGAVATFTGNIMLTGDAVLSAAAANLPKTQLLLVKGGAVDITDAYNLTGGFVTIATRPVVITFSGDVTTGITAIGPNSHDTTVILGTPVKLTVGTASVRLEAGAVPLTGATTITVANGGLLQRRYRSG